MQQVTLIGSHLYPGRLWIHAASKTPEGVEAVEGLYRDIYSAEGVDDLKFPEHYPTSVLVGEINFASSLSLSLALQVLYCDEGTVFVSLTSRGCWLRMLAADLLLLLRQSACSILVDRS
jgi:hypothetical protein